MKDSAIGPGVDCFIAFGSNLGDRERQLESALDALSRWRGLHLVARSLWRETEPVGCTIPQPRYLNGVARFRSEIPPFELLGVLLEIERRAGRTRQARNAPRTLDLDLLLYGDQNIDRPGLSVPHPRMEEREFVLEPLAEIAPALRLPSGVSVAERLRLLRASSRANSKGHFEERGAMEILTHPDAASTWCAREHSAGRTIGFVPTMGALHEGHLGLVERAVAENDRACASIFVNPLQFGEAEDFERYPRNLEQDAKMLAQVGCHMVFTGTLGEFFPGAQSPHGLESSLLVAPGPRAEGLEGEGRPGHFRGVATIVKRLFELVQPDRAYFGAKDWQQTLVVSDLARSRGGPSIVVCPTAREPSGLARSSRNERLSAPGRERAASLYRALCRARDAWRGGERGGEELSALMRAELQREGLEVEYATVRDPESWTAEQPLSLLERAMGLVAARVDGVRLIDNLRFDRP